MSTNDKVGPEGVEDYRDGNDGVGPHGGSREQGTAVLTCVSRRPGSPPPFWSDVGIPAGTPPRQALPRLAGWTRGETSENQARLPCGCPIPRSWTRGPADRPRGARVSHGPPLGPLHCHPTLTAQAEKTSDAHARRFPSPNCQVACVWVPRLSLRPCCHGTAPAPRLASSVTPSDWGSCGGLG